MQAVYYVTSRRFADKEEGPDWTRYTHGVVEAAYLYSPHSPEVVVRMPLYGRGQLTVVTDAKILEQAKAVASGQIQPSDNIPVIKKLTLKKSDFANVVDAGKTRAEAALSLETILEKVA